MGQLIAGPFCGQLFADFGAEVIKVEPPGTGDPMRRWGPALPKGRSLCWPIIARNKKSVTVDLRRPEGQDLARDLVRHSDVLVENFRPGTLEGWGLGWDDLSALNPRLVMIRVTGFGQTGPYAGRPGYGSIGEAMGGLRYVTGDPSAPPSRTGISIGDTLAAVFATVGGLVALHARDRHGRGQLVDAAIYEAVLAVMDCLLPEFEIAGRVRERTGAILPNVAPSNAYPTADGDLVLIAANQDSVFGRLAVAMGRPGLAADPCYATHEARGAHQAELDELVAAWTATLPTAHLERLLAEHAVPVGRVYRAPDLLADAHVAAREAIVRLADPDFGSFPMQGVVPKLSETPGAVRWAGPALGEHNREVYRGLLGLSDDRIGQLADAGVI